MILVTFTPFCALYQKLQVMQHFLSRIYVFHGFQLVLHFELLCIVSSSLTGTFLPQ
jgi:hypothetical protein